MRVMSLGKLGRTMFTFCAPCLFGLEGLVGDELKRLHVENVQVQNGRVIFTGDFETLVRTNLHLRTAERVLIQLGTFRALTFDALFEGTKALPWETFIPQDGNFPVKGYALDSRLMSVPDCQAIVKKAVVERLKQKYATNWFTEDGARYRIQFAIQNDQATLYLDTSGSGLHKRGYRPQAGAAPLRETLAAAMVLLSRYKGAGMFADPFCGSGTLPIEAALIAKNRAVGLGRTFDACAWRCLDRKLWDEAREEAIAAEYTKSYQIWGGDIDAECVTLAQENAKRAGVLDCVTFERADARQYTPNPEAVVVTNPPYGERLDDLKTAEANYRQFGKLMPPQQRLYLLSSHPGFEMSFGCKAVKKRKLYNGMIQCYLYMYYPSQT